jgi:hypothetical protein
MGSKAGVNIVSYFPFDRHVSYPLYRLNCHIIQSCHVLQLEYLELTVRRREVGEVRVVAGRAPAC